MKSLQGRLLRKGLTLFVLFLITASLGAMTGNRFIPTAHASALLPSSNNGAAPTPFMGWSTWNFIGSHPT